MRVRGGSATVMPGLGQRGAARHWPRDLRRRGARTPRRNPRCASRCCPPPTPTCSPPAPRAPTTCGRTPPGSTGTAVRRRLPTWRRPDPRLAAGPRGLVRRSATPACPLVVLGGEQQPSAELMELSTVPIGIAAEAHRYLAEGGPANLAQLHAFLSDTVLLTGEGFEPPAEIPAWGWLDGGRDRPTRSLPRTAPRVGRALLPGPRGQRQHRLRARPGRRDRRDRRGRRRADLLLLAAVRARRPVRRARHPRRPGRDRAGGRRQPARHGERRRRRRGLGRRAAAGARHPDPAGPLPDQPAARSGRPPTTA